MNAMKLQWNDVPSTMSETSKEHIKVLIELLKTIDYGKRTELLIDAHLLMTETDNLEKRFQDIRMELEEELTRIRRMIMMVERAELHMEK